VDRQGQRLRLRAEQAARLTDNLAGDLERLGGSISTVLIEGGSKATGVLRFLVQAATGTVNASGPAGPVAGGRRGLLGVVGGARCCSGVGTLIPRIQEARAALEAMGPAGREGEQGARRGRQGGASPPPPRRHRHLSAAYDALHPPTEVVVADTEHLTTQLEELANYVHRQRRRPCGCRPRQADRAAPDDQGPHVRHVVTGMGDSARRPG
jgi:hypothetical protein